MLQPRSSSSLKIQILLSLGLLLVMAALLVVSWLNPKTTAKPLDATVFPQARSLQAFQLGKPAFSQANLAGHWSLLFFGFTHCSEVCPATLRELKDAYQGLQSRHPELQVVFVSIDPEKDKTAELRRYVSAFDPHFIGLSGTLKEVRKLEEQFGVIVAGDTSAGPSNLNHTSSIFLINPQGQWIALLPYGLSAKQIQTHFLTIVEQAAHA